MSRRLEIRGFTSLTTYADGRPSASLAELADEIGANIPPVVLEQKLVAEAKAAGTMERCARSLLARTLRAELADGWQSGTAESGDGADSQFRLSEVFHALGMALPGAYEDAIVRVQRAMTTAVLPSGWLPDGPDDPALLELFASYWTAQSTCFSGGLTRIHFAAGS